jgi:uncharacterized membrane protein (UPF0136 family)
MLGGTHLGELSNADQVLSNQSTQHNGVRKEAIMLKAFSTPRDRSRSLLLLAFCGVLAIAASIVGVSDNPPGIALAFLSTIAFVLAFVHRWRTPKPFLLLALASVLGLVLFAILHNVFEVIASRMGESGLTHDLLNGIGVGFFLIAILVCPSGLLVGLVGALITASRKDHSQQGSPAA